MLDLSSDIHEERQVCSALTTRGRSIFRKMNHID